MDLGLEGRCALVPAASAGIGKAIATALARDGCRVAICSRDRGRIDAAASEIHSVTGAEVLALKADITRPEEIDSWVCAAASHFGRVDILVTNAGGPPAGASGDADDAAWRGAVDLTLLSVVRLCRAVIPAMRHARWGRIVHLASVTVREPLDRMVLSNSLRAAVAGFSKTLARELGPEGITSNVVCPGPTDTARLRELAGTLAQARETGAGEILAAWSSEIPARRLGRPEEIADLAAFLCSERAAFINGTVIAADGGFTRAIM